MTPELQAIAVSFWPCMIAIGAGVVASLLNRLYQLELSGTIMPPVKYWRQHPYAVLLCLFSAYLLGLFWYFSGLLNIPLAILTGVMSETAFDSLRTRAAGKIRSWNEKENSPLDR